MAAGEGSDRIERLLQSIADGEAVDLRSLEEAAAADEDIRRLLEALRLVSGVAEVHRSPVLDALGAETPDAHLATPSTRPPEAPRPPEAVASRKWGHLLLMDKIGEGAFGEVFHALDTWLDHGVALKLLKPHLENRDVLLREARTLAKIRHENVVRVHGADVHDGRMGFWMEFVQGQTLADVVAREGVRSGNEAAVIGQALCQALGAVHAKQIAHRDIKAHNVMREQGGRIVLMDFGAGELMAGGDASGQRVGTPLYLAPELFENPQATAQTDIYALGVLLFYLVSEQYPVVADSIDGLKRAHQNRERQRLGDLRPDLPDSFVRVIDQMLAPDTSRRFASAGAAGEALGAVVTPSGPTEVSTATVSRRLRFALAGLGAGAAFVTLFGLLSTASFNLTFGRSGEFASESPLQWLVWGTRGLLALAIRTGLALVVLTLLVAVVRLVCRLIPPIGRGYQRWRQALATFSRERGLDDATLALQVVTASGIVAFLAVGLLYWEQVTAFAIYIDNASPAQLAALAPANGPMFDRYARLVEFILWLYGIGAWAVYRSAGRARQGVQRGAAASALVVPILALLFFRAMPYRVVYHNDEFERIDLNGRRCYSIGETAEQYLLHCPDASPPRNQKVEKSRDGLRPTGIRESVFTPADAVR